MKAASKKQLKADVEFLFAEAVAWIGNKDPDEMDEFGNDCRDARDRLLAVIKQHKPVKPAKV
jgi:hypothetical protein